MSKVFEYFNELSDNDGPCCSSIMEKGVCEFGPTDEELTEIEAELETKEWYELHKDCDLC